MVRGQQDDVLEAGVGLQRGGYRPRVVRRATQRSDVGVGRILVDADDHRVALGPIGEVHDLHVSVWLGETLRAGLLRLLARGYLERRFTGTDSARPAVLCLLACGDLERRGQKECREGEGEETRDGGGEGG